MFGMFSRYPTFMLDPRHALTSDNAETCDVSTNSPWSTNGPWIVQYYLNTYQNNQYAIDSFLSSLPMNATSALGRYQLFGSFFMYNQSTLPEDTPVSIIIAKTCFDTWNRLEAIL
jgi:hypothetical protein